MKKFLMFLLAGSLAFACKKEKDPEPEPEPEPRGTITVGILTYDSMGAVLGDKSGIRVRLNTGQTFTTPSQGEVKFEGLVFGDYVVDLFREGWEGPPMVVKLNAANVGLTLPMAQRSTYQIKNIAAQSFAKDSITLSFDLDKVVPQGKSVQIAILGSTVTPVTDVSYHFVDFIQVQGGLKKYNIAELPGIKAYLASLAENSTFYITALPVSYGKFQSTAIARPVIIGDNLLNPGTVLLVKNWF